MSLTFFLAVFIIMSDLSNFEITLEHGRGGLIVFEICFGNNYPNTLFRDSEWSHSTLFRESLVLIMMSTLATSELFIHAFYSKGASCTVAPNPDEQVILRNLGTMTLLTVLQLYPHIECVRLEASGGFPWYNKRIVPFVKYMGDGDLWTNTHALPFALEPPHDSLEDDMITSLNNLRLVEYYMKRGFRVDEYSSPGSALLSGKASYIKEACWNILEIDSNARYVLNNVFVPQTHVNKKRQTYR